MLFLANEILVEIIKFTRFKDLEILLTTNKKVSVYAAPLYTKIKREGMEKISNIIFEEYLKRSPILKSQIKEGRELLKTLVENSNEYDHYFAYAFQDNLASRINNLESCFEWGKIKPSRYKNPKIHFPWGADETVKALEELWITSNIDSFNLMISEGLLIVNLINEYLPSGKGSNWLGDPLRNRYLAFFPRLIRLGDYPPQNRFLNISQNQSKKKRYFTSQQIQENISSSRKFKLWIKINSKPPRKKLPKNLIIKNIYSIKFTKNFVIKKSDKKL